MDQLSPKDKEYLSKFATEYYAADFRGNKPLHKSQEKRREIYRSNNSRNQDTTSYLGNYRKLESFETAVKNGSDRIVNSPEDALIMAIDLKKKSTT